MSAVFLSSDIPELGKVVGRDRGCQRTLLWPGDSLEGPTHCCSNKPELLSWPLPSLSTGRSEMGALHMVLAHFSGRLPGSPSSCLWELGRTHLDVVPEGSRQRQRCHGKEAGPIHRVTLPICQHVCQATSYSRNMYVCVFVCV